MVKKTLFIDGQIFQTTAWDRGMGKYSLALLKSMLADKRNDYQEVHLIFTKRLDLPAEVKKHIKLVAPQAKHIFADLKTPDDPSKSNVTKLQKANREILDVLVKKYSQPAESAVDFLLPALFIDEICSTFPTQTKKILLFYDLIPLQFSERYGHLSNYGNYLKRFKIIFEADIILTISQTVADDVALNLGISQAKIFNIDGAAIERSIQTVQKPTAKLPTRYILMPSGNEMRKNNIRAVQGFAAYLQDSHDSDLALVITSTFDTTTQHALKAHSNNIIFTGNVTEEELHWLFEHAQAILFVPEYEGLGLPILEAAEVGRPVVCSNLMVFNEMSPTAFYYSNPFDPFSIADALNQAVNGTEFTDKLQEYPKILKKYTWANTAQKAHNAISSAKTKSQAISRMRIAVMAPSPGGYSAIGKLIMLLHPAMEEYFDIDYYLESGKSHRGFARPNYLPYVSNVFPSTEFNRKKYKLYDAVVYHIGNSEFHVDTIKSALYLPGYGIIHDTHLENIFKADLQSFGYMTQNRLDAERTLDEMIGNPKANYISSIVNNQLGLVAHSSFSKDSLNKSSLDIPPRTVQLNIPTAIPKQVMPENPKKQLAIGLAGIIDPAKGLDVVESIAKLPDFSDCKIFIFGIPLVSDLVIQRLQAYPNVQVDINLTDFQFQNLLSQLDIIISYRPDYRGYPSLATIEAMRFGVIPIVKKMGWYDELPNNAVVKVSSEKELIEELKELISNPARREKIKFEARKFISENHSYQSYAKSLYDMINTHLDTNKIDAVSGAIKKELSIKAVKKLIRQKGK